MKPKSDCRHFVGMTTNPDVCAKWIRPKIIIKPGFQMGPIPEPFCQVEEKCPNMGLRLIDQQWEKNRG